MKCENEFCLYNKNQKCKRLHIHIGALGQCENCKIINLNNEFFNKEKQKQYKKLINNINSNPLLKNIDEL